MEKSYRFPPSRNSEGVGAVLSLVTLSDANFNTLWKNQHRIVNESFIANIYVAFPYFQNTTNMYHYFTYFDEWFETGYDSGMRLVSQ